MRTPQNLNGLELAKALRMMGCAVARQSGFHLRGPPR